MAFYPTLPTNLEMKNIFLFAFLVFILPTQSGIFAQEEDLNSYSETENVSYTASEFSGIEINNKHGDINVSAWKKDSIKIDVTVTIDAEDKEKSEEIREQIEIRDNETDSLIIMQTWFDEDFYSNHSFSIDYDVHLPAKTQLNLTNRFGDIITTRVTGKMDITLEYGHLKQENSDRAETIHANFSFSEAQLGSFSNAEMQLLNSNVEIKNISTGFIDGKYCHIDLTKAGKLNIKASTARFNIGSINEIDLSGNFCFASIDKIHDTGNIEITNGLLIIRSVSKQLKELSVSNNNAPVKLSLSPSLPYILNGEVTNGQFRHYRADIFRIIRDNEKVSFSGKHNTQQNGASIVLFNENAGINIVK